MKTERGILKLCFTKEGEGFSRSTLKWRQAIARGTAIRYSALEKIEAFAKAISEYPLAEPGRCLIEGSHKHTGVRINVSSISSRGYLGVTVRLGDERQGLPMTVEVELLSTYQALANFSRNLLSAIRNES